MTNKHLFSLANELVVDAALPSTLNFWYQIGSLLALAMIVQIATGIFLAMFYVSSIDLAFYSIEYIMRDVSGGFMIRYLHANGASVIFGFLYLHIYRGLYYGSYQSPSVVVWTVGVVIFLLMMMTAFIGYVLPWGQMSFWAATVITNMLTAIPTIGSSIAEWIWGGYSVDAATLTIQHPDVPEWYFLPFYAILRSIPSKLGGVILMFGAIAVWFVLPLVNPTPSSSFASVRVGKPMVFLVGNVIVLGWLGAAPLATPLILAGQIVLIGSHVLWEYFHGCWP